MSLVRWIIQAAIFCIILAYGYVFYTEVTQTVIFVCYHVPEAVEQEAHTATKLANLIYMC